MNVKNGDSGRSGLLEEARAAHPEFDLTQASFRAYVDERFAEDQPLEATTATELYLCFGALQQHPVALRRFQERLRSQVQLATRGMGLSPSECEELEQLLLTRVLLPDEGGRRRLADFQGRGSLNGWLRAMAVRAALNFRRGRQEEHWEQELWQLWPDQSVDAETKLLRQRFRDDFARAFEASFRSLEKEDSNLLRMHLLDALTLDQLAVVFGAHRATLGRRIQRIKAALMAATKRQLAHHLRSSRDEVEELIALAESQLELSLRRILSSSVG